MLDQAPGREQLNEEHLTEMPEHLEHGVKCGLILELVIIVLVPILLLCIGSGKGREKRREGGREGGSTQCSLQYYSPSVFLFKPKTHSCNAAR